MGTDTTNPPYFFKQNAEKPFYDYEKENLLKDIWKAIYTEEEEDEDNENENIVREHLNKNLHRISPYTYADPIRLNVEFNFLTYDVTTEQIKCIMKHIKNTCSGINKTILLDLPEEAIIRLKHVFNASLSARYFPDKFKMATIKFIPKKDRNIKYPINYRPISLIEVPGKYLKE